MCVVLDGKYALIDLSTPGVLKVWPVGQWQALETIVRPTNVT